MPVGWLFAGNLPGSKERVAREQHEQESSESSAVSTNHAVECAPRRKDREFEPFLLT
jgi:hypothetical protein